MYSRRKPQLSLLQISSNGNIALIVLVLGVFIIGTVTVMLIFLHRSPQQVSPPGNQPHSNKPTQANKIEQTPKLSFDSYRLVNATQTEASGAAVYSLRSNFTQTQIANIAKNFSLPTSTTSKTQSKVFFDADNSATRGILVFDSLTGSFTYQSFGGLKHPSVDAQLAAPQQAIALISTLGLTDPSITCKQTYRKTTSPAVVFVECHREWSRIGLPIITLPGVLNISENTKLADLQVGHTDTNSPDDPTIIQASDGANGKARPNDFNTITIGLYEDGSIYSVTSNLRWLQKIAAQKTNLISRAEALKRFSNHKAHYSLTIPAGTGMVDWQKIYPENIAAAKQATINETALVYLEHPTGSMQDSYAPYYVIHGTAKLNSGYTVRFVEALPAQAQEQLVGQGAVAGEHIEVAQTIPNRQLKIDTFGFPSSPPVPFNGCQSPFGTEITLQIPGYGTLVVVQRPNAPHTFYLKSVSAAVSDMNKAREALYRAVEEQLVISVAKAAQQDTTVRAKLTSVDKVKEVFKQIEISPEIRDTDKLPSYIETATRAANRILDLVYQDNLASYANKPDLFPAETIRGISAIFVITTTSNDPSVQVYCYISGASPAIFVYPERPTTITIIPTTRITYTDPSIAHAVWNVTAQPDGTIINNGIARSQLYYEYDTRSIAFHEPKEGFVISRTNIGQFLTTNLAMRLGLTAKETETLVSEVTNALPATGNHFKIALLPQEEITQKLPLVIQPTPNRIYRLHFLVTTKNDSQAVIEPTIQPVNRSGFTVIEIGARAQ